MNSSKSLNSGDNVQKSGRTEDFLKSLHRHQNLKSQEHESEGQSTEREHDGTTPKNEIFYKMQREEESDLSSRDDANVVENQHLSSLNSGN